MSLRVQLFPADAQIPALAPLSPRSRGRGGVEALTSFIAGLALHHRCAPHGLVHYVLVPESERLSGRWSKVRSGEGHLVNAYGKVASLMAAAVSRTTGVEAHKLTAVGLEAICDPKGKHFMHTERPWCPSCYLEARRAGSPVWDPLYTYARSSTVCVWHEKGLRFSCLHCKRGQRLIPRTPFLDLCEFCGADLAAQPHPSDGEQASTKDLWFARAFMDLIEAMGRCEVLSAANFLRSVIAIRDTHFGGGTRTLSVGLRLAKSSAKNWIERGSRPTWMSLVDLGWRLDISPTQLVGSSLSLTEPSLWRIDDAQVLDREHRRRTVLELRRLGRMLRQIVRGEIDEIPSGVGLRAIARRLGVTPGFLGRKFPQTAQAVINQRKEQQEALAARRDSEKIARIETVRAALAGQGLPDTTRNLRRIGGLSVSELIEAGRTRRIDT